MPTEADTCRKFVVPKLQEAGWDNEPHSIAEQRTITDGRVVPVGKGFIRKPPKRVDYLLRYARDFPLAVLEAKERYMRCKDCSQVRGYPYKRSHLVALRPTKISALDPPSTWWPGER
jgi:type I restriction enzyme R subunit